MIRSTAIGSASSRSRRQVVDRPTWTQYLNPRYVFLYSVILGKRAVCSVSCEFVVFTWKLRSMNHGRSILCQVNNNYSWMNIQSFYYFDNFEIIRINAAFSCFSFELSSLTSLLLRTWSSRSAIFCFKKMISLFNSKFFIYKLSLG